MITTVILRSGATKNLGWSFRPWARGPSTPCSRHLLEARERLYLVVDQIGVITAMGSMMLERGGEIPFLLMIAKKP